MSVPPPAPRLSWTDVRDVMAARILSRQYPLGARLPRDADIATELGCTRTTVQRAMQDLEKSGLIDRRRKGGTHVTPDPVTRATLDIPLVRREVEGRGAIYGYRLISRALGPCPAPIAHGFALSGPREMLHVVALHLADGQTYIYEDRWIDLATVPDIAAVDLAHISANEWLLRHKPYSRVDIVLSALNAPADVAGHLNCALGAALLVTSRRTWIGDAPITAVRAIAGTGYQLTATGFSR